MMIQIVISVCQQHIPSVRVIFYFKFRCIIFRLLCVTMDVQITTNIDPTTSPPLQLPSPSQQSFKRSLSPDQADALDQPRKNIHFDPEHPAPDQPLSSQEEQMKDLKQTPESKESTPQKEQDQDVLLTQPLRQKYAHLIPDYQSANYTFEQKMLLRIQAKLDQHLIYLKEHRGRRKGDFFKSIRKNLIEGCHIIVDLSQIKQLIFIDPSLYLCSHQEDKDHNTDVLIDLPPKANIAERRAQFKQKLYKYLQGKGAFDKGCTPSAGLIPKHKFKFEEKLEEENKEILKKNAQKQEGVQQPKQQKKLSLKNMFSKDFKFKQALYSKIQEKQNKLKEQAQIQSQSKRKFDGQDVMKVLDELHLSYLSKKISNMFHATLILKIAKQLNMHDHLVVEIVELIVEKGKGYLKKVAHHKGLILQMDRLIYQEAREELLGLDF